jgi:uncharacterized protein with HEPN domain
MLPEDTVRVRHMIEACEAAMEFVSGKTRTDLDNDVMLEFALARAIEVVGEAAARLSASARDQMSEVQWQSVIGMRNRLIHAYFDIDPDIIWRTATAEIPVLLRHHKSAVSHGD